MKKSLAFGCAVSTLVFFLGACAPESPTSTTTKKPTSTNQEIVESRQEQINMPGGEGKKHILINICHKKKGSVHTCENHKPSKVKYCYPGDNWPQCKND